VGWMSPQARDYTQAWGMVWAVPSVQFCVSLPVDGAPPAVSSVRLAISVSIGLL